MKTFIRSLLILVFVSTNTIFAAPPTNLDSSAETIQLTNQEDLVSQTAFSGLASLVLSGGVFAVFIIFLIVMFYVVARWKIYSKAGYPGWHSIIPILELISFTRFTGSWMFIIGSFFIFFAISSFPQIISLVLLLLSFGIMYKTAKSFGRGIGFAFGLTFLGIIFFPILAFNKNITYIGPGGKKI